jgi:hypothetical protein
MVEALRMERLFSEEVYMEADTGLYLKTGFTGKS